MAGARADGTSSTLSPPDHGCRILLPIPPALLCASHDAYLLDPTSTDEVSRFTGSTTAINGLLAPPAGADRVPPAFLASAESSRYINVFDLSTPSRLVGSLVLESDARGITLSQGGGQSVEQRAAHTVLAATTSSGELELFTSPFEFDVVGAAEAAAASLKARRKGMTRRAIARLRVESPEKASVVMPIIDSCFDGAHLLFAWSDGGVRLGFERVPIRGQQDDGQFPLKGTMVVKKSGNSADLGPQT